VYVNKHFVSHDRQNVECKETGQEYLHLTFVLKKISTVEGQTEGHLHKKESNFYEMQIST
jgi:hypothetical protein